MSRKKFVGMYRSDTKTGQAVVTLSNPAGRRREYQLGPYGSYESKMAFEKIVREWKAADRELPGEQDYSAAANGQADAQLAVIVKHWHGFTEAVRGSIVFLASCDLQVKDQLLKERKWRKDSSVGSR